jgi:hypothetical protein
VQLGGRRLAEVVGKGRGEVGGERPVVVDIRPPVGRLVVKLDRRVQALEVLHGPPAWEGVRLVLAVRHEYWCCRRAPLKDPYDRRGG